MLYRWLAILTVLLAACTNQSSRQPPENVPVPSGMVYVPGNENGNSPVAPFFMDVHPVTVAEFHRFVQATGYRTEAQKFGNSGVFDVASGSWQMVDSADYQYPFGRSQPRAADDHPVTQVSWNDAVAYCRWAKKRLPTEAEWEWAARNATEESARYPWGDELVVNGKYLANTWQGSFPVRSVVEDGYQYTSPVGAFGKTPLGLTDMGGNVWQWCSDDIQDQSTGEPGKVQRGGSYLCDPAVCHGFQIGNRSSSTPETGLAHVGFRAVRDIPSAK